MRRRIAILLVILLLSGCTQRKPLRDEPLNHTHLRIYDDDGGYSIAMPYSVSYGYPAFSLFGASYISFNKGNGSLCIHTYPINPPSFKDKAGEIITVLKLKGAGCEKNFRTTVNEVTNSSFNGNPSYDVLSSSGSPDNPRYLGRVILFPDGDSLYEITYLWKAGNDAEEELFRSMADSFQIEGSEGDGR